MARPPKPINWDMVEHQIAAGCNGMDIAQDLRIDPDTFYERFKKEYGESFSDYTVRQARVGAHNIKFIQYAKAIGLTKKGDTAMLKLLGAHWLGQTETNLKEIEEASKKGTIDAVREIQAENRARAGATSRPDMETEQSVLDQGLSGESGEVRDELGPEGIV